MKMQNAAIVSSETRTMKRPNAGVLPLSMSKAGEMRQVHSVRGKDDVRKFLGNLGFAEGAQITLISELNGNVIANVKGSRIAISKSMANRILTV